MAVPRKKDTGARWVRTFQSPRSFDDDLGHMGAWVGPRTGPAKRDQGQTEDYILRRLLVAWRYKGNLSFHFEVKAAHEEKEEPDFCITWPNGQRQGIEVTEAGDEAYQAWATAFEKRKRKQSHAEIVPFPFSEEDTARQIAEAIARKVEKYEKGWYQTTDVCDLIVYDNTPNGGYRDNRKVIAALGRPNQLIGRFRQVHLLTGEFVYLDLFGDLESIDVTKFYEIDFANWISEQVECLRAGATDQLDIDNVAEELETLGKSDRRALRSHLHNLMLHLLKWEHQPERRSDSWVRSISNARTEIAAILDDSPSLNGFLKNQVVSQYSRAREAARRETGLKIEQFPEHLAYELELILDDEFLPEGGDQMSAR